MWREEPGQRTCGKYQSSRMRKMRSEATGSHSDGAWYVQCQASGRNGRDLRVRRGERLCVSAGVGGLLGAMVRPVPNDRAIPRSTGCRVRWALQDRKAQRGREPANLSLKCYVKRQYRYRTAGQAQDILARIWILRRTAFEHCRADTCLVWTAIRR